MTYRIYGFGGTAAVATANQGANWRIDDLFLTSSTTAIPAVAPTFSGATVNGVDSFLTPSQRSQVTSLVLAFSAPVNIAADAFTVSNIGLVTAQAPAALASTQILVTGSGTSSITLRWDAGPGVVSRLGSGVLGNSLADGNWVLDIDPSKVTAVLGGLSLTGDTSFGDVPADNFFRLFGDSNGDGLLTASDTAAFRSAFSAGSPTVNNAAFDWNGDGFVSNATNSPDRINFLANSGKRRRTNFGFSF